MAHVIKAVLPGSIGEELGLVPGDALLTIDGHEIADVVDYEHFISRPSFVMRFQLKNGDILEASVEKDEDEGVGIVYESGLMSRPRSCANKCIFCFVDQMPRGMRNTLYFKDDDWRLSLIMGNYISLTNVSDRELARIIERGAGPLYVSVHTTDDDLRKMMMGARAGGIMDKLRRLAEADIRFHCQAVLCPGINDGAALEKTVGDLFSLFPHAASLAVVPVGLTGHREGLYGLRGYTAAEAKAVLDLVERWQKLCLPSGTRFIFASDEFYIVAGEKMPPYEAYEDFCQIENGIGMTAKFEREFDDALADASPVSGAACTIVTGELAAPFMRGLAGRMRPLGIEADVLPVRNRLFGGGVTVAGLVTAGDIIAEAEGKRLRSPVLIPQNMLREGGDVFLDGITVSGLAEALGAPVITVPVDGGELIRAAGGGKL